MVLDSLFTIFLVLLNGFFVAAEFAIVKVRSSQLELQVNQGSTLAKSAKHIVEHLDSYLSATQLGITLASLGLGWVGESVVSEMIKILFLLINQDASPELIHSISFPIAFALISIMHIVFGELAPKTIAIRFPLRTAIIIAMPLQFFHLVFKPFIWSLNGLAGIILRLIGINPIKGQDIHSEEELRLLLTESEEGGAIKQSEHELIQNVFEFDDRIVKQILIPRTKVSAIDIELPYEEIIDKVLEEGYSRLPVYKDSLDNIIGIIYTKDLLKGIKHENFEGINKILRPVYYVPIGKKINDLLRELQSQHIQMAVVTNEFGGTVGIVTMEDIIEELVGEIQDEYDEEKPFVEKRSETEFIVNAQSPIADVNEFLPIALPENTNYDTVSGLMNHIFDRIPATNEVKIYGGYEFTILKRYKHSVETVKMKVMEDIKNTGSS
jgi:CBS domain containing-hemolysin-like protein